MKSLITHLRDHYLKQCTISPEKRYVPDLENWLRKYKFLMPDYSTLHHRFIYFVLIDEHSLCFTYNFQLLFLDLNAL